MLTIPENITAISDKFYGRYIPVPESGCWLWLSTSTIYGYGQVRFDNRIYMAHRVSYFLAHPDFDQSKIILHKCDVGLCINPDHLVAGTHKENSEDMVKKGRQNKGQGVPFSKLTPGIAMEIYNAEGPYREIGEKYGVHNTNVSLIKNGKIWQHITKGKPNPRKRPKKYKIKAVALARISAEEGNE